MTPPRPGGQFDRELASRVSPGVPQLSASDGLAPFGGLVFDAVGNLYGTTTLGGAASTVCDQGSTFKVGRWRRPFSKLTPDPNGAWDTALSTAFPGDANGGYPNGTDHVAVDLQRQHFLVPRLFEGNVTYEQHMSPRGFLALAGCGVVFELTP